MSDLNFLTISSPDGSLMLRFCPAAGGCVTQFQKISKDAPPVDVFRPYDPSHPLSPVNTSCFPMAPVSNRISNCELVFEGEKFYVGPPFGQEPNYLHGDGWTSPWTVEDHGNHQVVMILEKEASASSPYAYMAEQAFRLQNDKLTMSISITNKKGCRLPFGFGHHPYFPRTPETMVKAPLSKVWLCDRDMHPTILADVPEKWDFARGVLMADQSMLPAEHGFGGRDLIDNCFPDWGGVAEIIQPRTHLNILMTADPVFRHLVIYNPPLEKDFFAIEAVTNTIDAFNLMAKGVPDTGTRVLEPGQTLGGSVYFEVRSLIQPV